MIFQAETSECGLACLAMVAGFHGTRIDITSLRNSYAISAAGASIKHLMGAATKLDLKGRPLKLEPEDLRKLKLPAILHWDLDHFVVLRKVTAKNIILHDPAVGKRKFNWHEIGVHFTGIAVEFSPSTNFKKQDKTQVTKIGELFTFTGQFHRTAIQVFALSLFIQLLALVTPLYVQLALDQGLAKQDPDLILIIALIFLTVAVAKAVLGYLRGLLLIYFSNQLGFQMVTNVFTHLIRLPVSFFEKRDMGDIVSRFSSLENVKNMVTQEMITAIVDGIFSITTLIILYLYSPLLATMALGTISLFTLVRVISIPIEKNRRQEVLIAEAKQSTNFMENIRSITVTKNYGIERQRLAAWQNSYADTINAGYHLGHFQLGAGTLQGLLFAVDHVATIYFGAKLVYAMELTIGQLMSFVFLKQHFVGSISALLPKLAEIKLLRLELERISDITLSEAEPEALEAPIRQQELVGEVDVANLQFSYSDDEASVLANVSFKVKAGTCCVITGPSGSGKSTLLKLLLGLEKPNSGTVKLDGHQMNSQLIRTFKESISALLHNDTLLTGSVAYNIHLDKDSSNQERLSTACLQAGVLQEIMAMPMAFNTPVGDMGNCLSAGQSQRVLLARAIYRNPKLLVLDEALAHLSQEMADTLLRNLKKMGTTIIMVTHNPALVKLADQHLRLVKHGQVTTIEQLPPQVAA